MIATSRSEFKTKILRELGQPVVKVNISDEQIEDVIDEAFHYWSTYHAYAQQRSYYKIELTQQDIDNKYVTLPDNIIAVSALLNPTGLGGTTSTSSGDNMFSFQYQFTATSIWDMVRFGNLSGYFIANQFLSEVDRLVGQYPNVRFTRYMNRLELDFSTGSFEPGRILVAEVHAILDPQVYNKVWSDRDFLKLAVAYAKIVWGRTLRKYSGFQLPAGMTLNGDAVYAEGQSEAEAMEARIIRMSPPLGFIVA